MPGSGSLTRSAINQQAGGRTQWAGVISAAAVAATMFLFSPYARYIPRAALAGLLIVTAARMVNIPDLRFHMRASNFDRVIVLVTAISAFAISIEFCILVGVTMSFFLAVPRAASLHLAEFVVAPGGYTHERLDADTPDPRMLIFGLEGELFFGASVAIEEHLERIEERVTPETRVVILRLKRTRAPDAVGLAALEGFFDRLRDRGVRVIVCGVRKELHEAMSRSGLLSHLDPQDVVLEQPVRQTSTMKAIERANAVLAAEA